MADDDIADHLDAAVRQGDRQRLLMIEQRLRARRHWDAQEGRDVGEEVDDIAWLLARCRLLEAERDKAKQQGREQILALLRSYGHISSTGDSLANDLARAARGVSVPETP